MNIVHVAPPFLALDENLQYGGIERIINMLRYKQQQLDIPTFVLAPSDSTVAGLIPTVPSIGIDEIYAPLTGQDKVRQSKWAILNHVVKVIEYARSSNEEKKLFHVHDDYLLPFLPQILGKPYLFSAYNHYPDFWQTEEHPDVAKDVRNIVAVSEAHKRNLESHGFSIHAVVYNGIEPKDFPFSDQKDNFLLSLGVIAQHKGQKLAVEIAQESAQNLIIAGNIGDNAYFDKFIKPYVTFDLSTESDKLAAYNSLTQKQGIIYVGSVNDTQKKPLFKKAKAFLMPTLCEDPCPAVPIESLV